MNTETILRTSLPFGFYLSRLVAFALVPLGGFFCYAYQFPIAVPVGLLLIAFVASQNRSEFILELDAEQLRVILPSFYGAKFSTTDSYDRTEIKDISLSKWEKHASADKSMYALSLSNLTGMDRNRTYSNLEIFVEDKVLQETAKYTFRISTKAQDFINTMARKEMFAEFVSAAEKQIRGHSRHQ